MKNGNFVFSKKEEGKIEKKVKLYDKLQYIKKHDYLLFTLRFLKVNIIHIVLECLISLYVLELFASFTWFYLKDPTQLVPNFLTFIIFPSVTVIGISIFFGVWCTLFWIKNVYLYANRIFEENAKINPEDLYNEITNDYRRTVVKAHLKGIGSYFFLTLMIPMALVIFWTDYFNDNKFEFVFFITSIGTILGVIWNVTGIFRNQRIVWDNLVKKFQTPELQKKIHEDNFKYFVKNIVGNIFSIVFLCILAIIIVFNIHPLIKSNFKELITEYNFLVLSFVTLVVYYVKKVISLIYFSENEENIFPGIKTILQDCKKIYKQLL